MPNTVTATVTTRATTFQAVAPVNTFAPNVTFTSSSAVPVTSAQTYFMPRIPQTSAPRQTSLWTTRPSLAQTTSQTVVPSAPTLVQVGPTLTTPFQYTSTYSYPNPIVTPGLAYTPVQTTVANTAQQQTIFQPSATIQSVPPGTATNVTSLHTRPPTAKIPEFDGNVVSASQWLKNYVTTTRAMGWTDEMRANLFANYLKGSALVWFESKFGAQNDESIEQLLNPPNLSLPDIFNAFNERFRSRHARMEYQNDYVFFKPKPEETLLEAFWRFRAVSGLVCAATPETDRIHHLSKRIFDFNPTVAEQISACQSFDQVESTLQRLIAIGFKSRNANDKSPSTRPLNTNIRSNFNRPPFRPNPNPTSQNTNTQPATAVTKMPIRCLNCWQVGHLKRDCPKPIDMSRVNANYLKYKQMKENSANTAAALDEQFNISEEELEHAQQWAYYQPEESDVEHSVASSQSSVDQINVLQSAKPVKPVVDVIIDGRCYRALLDDGSENTFMSTSVAHHVKGCQKGRWTRSAISTPNGQIITPTTAFVDLNICIPALAVEAQCYVGLIKNLAYDVILGEDFQEKIKLIKDHNTRTLYIIENFEEFYRKYKRPNDRHYKWTHSSPVGVPELNAYREGVPTLCFLNSSETLPDCHQQWKAQWEVKDALSSELPTSCFDDELKANKIIGHSSSTYTFSPGEEKLIDITLSRSVDRLCLLTSHSATQDWDIADGLIDDTVRTPHILIKNKCSLTRTLDQDTLLVTVEEVKEHELIPINQNEPNSTDSCHPSYTQINEKIWSEINAEPSASSLYLTSEESKFSEEDDYFSRAVDTEFLSKWNVGPDLTPRQLLMFERYLKKFREIYALKVNPSDVSMSGDTAYRQTVNLLNRIRIEFLKNRNKSSRRL